MSDQNTRALLQSILSVHSEESGALMNELFRRIIVSGLTVSNAGVFSLQPVLTFNMSTPGSPSQGQFWIDLDVSGKIMSLKVQNAGTAVVLATVTLP